MATIEKIDLYTPKEGETDLNGKHWPMDDVFKELLKGNIDKYLDYVERTYVGVKSRTAYTKPKFPPKLWSCHAAALAMEPTDTNRNEGWNSVLRSTVSRNAGLW